MLASSSSSKEEEATTQKEEETSKENTTNNTARIDAPSFIFAVVVFCLVMFSVVFGAFVKVPTRRSYDRTQKITSAHDVHFAHAHHLHHHNNHRDDDDEEEEQGV